MACAAAAPDQAIGFTAGGAQDAANFRENVAAGQLPLPSDVTFEGLIKVGGSLGCLVVAFQLLTLCMQVMPALSTETV
jgi:hypothetical protein